MINLLRISFIILWTGICGLLGMLLMLLTWHSAWIIKFLGNILWGPAVCAVCGIKLTTEGKENIDRSKGCIYVANHSSLLDIAVLVTAIPLPLYFVAKEELKKVPVLGQYMMLLGHIFVDRKNKDKAMQSMRSAADKINKGKNVITFPEGTRSKNGRVQLFKKGTFVIAKEGNIDIVPIGISGAFKVLSSGSKKITPGKIHINIGQRIPGNELSNMSVEEIGERAYRNVVTLSSGKE